MIEDAAAIDRTISTLRTRLLARRTPDGHWEGHLASSALSTATALVALSLDEQIAGRVHGALIRDGVAWLAANQNDDGGWGDTVVSASNLSTTVLSWAALSQTSGPTESVERAERWIAARAGDLRPETVSAAILAAYGEDRTFSAPILTVLALTGKLGRADGWRFVPQLPFELAACPHRWFEWLRLPVVSYALPALVAIGQVRHHHKPTRNVLLAQLRTSCRSRTAEVARRMQPESGGYLEATPLTAFVVMSFLASGGSSAIVDHGVSFLRASARADGSWPIDSNLATWVTTLSVRALAERGEGAPREAMTSELADRDRRAIAEWLLRQQVRREHPFTHAKPGGWAWTDLAGGVPDADDTAGALIALQALGGDQHGDAAAAGIQWLLNLQNRDGGIPTFCRGWGALPFDRSAPDLTAHALEAWGAWHTLMPPHIQHRIGVARRNAMSYLERCQAADGSWSPLWFGNEEMPQHENPTYGTARVLIALGHAPLDARAAGAQRRALAWLLRAQNADGGWGGGSTRSSIEETGVAVEALAATLSAAAIAKTDQSPGTYAALMGGVRWLVKATNEGHDTPAAPIGLYFARLWYYEELYPFIFPLAGLSRARGVLERSQETRSRWPGIGD